MTETSSSGPKPIGEILSAQGVLKREVQCDKHGAYEAKGYCVPSISNRVTWTRCPACQAEEKAAQDAKEAAERAERQRQRFEHMLQATAVPPRFRGKDFDSFIADTPEKARVLAICRAYSENFEDHLRRGKGMVFSGPLGAGKSHLAAAILQSLLPRYVGAYVTFRELILAFRDTWGKSGKSERDVLNHFNAMPLLVIDEIGTGYGSDAERANLFDVIDGRYRNLMPSLLLTNLGTEEMQAAMGERAFDRLVETMKWVPFQWGESSFRARARKLDR